MNNDEEIKAKLEDVEKLIKQVGSINIQHINYIKPCLEVLDYFVKWHERTEENEWLIIRINEVVDITMQLLKAPLDNGK